MALLERGHEGLNMGPRHAPMNSAFMNGTVTGDGVWIPMESILGGQTRCGYGWHMFVECLAEGRGVSLPAGAMGAALALLRGAGKAAPAEDERDDGFDYSALEDAHTQVIMII